MSISPDRPSIDPVRMQESLKAKKDERNEPAKLQSVTGDQEYAVTANPPKGKEIPTPQAPKPPQALLQNLPPFPPQKLLESLPPVGPPPTKTSKEPTDEQVDKLYEENFPLRQVIEKSIIFPQFAAMKPPRAQTHSEYMRYRNVEIDKPYDTECQKKLTELKTQVKSYLKEHFKEVTKTQKEWPEELKQLLSPAPTSLAKVSDKPKPLSARTPFVADKTQKINPKEDKLQEIINRQAEAAQPDLEVEKSQNRPWSTEITHQQCNIWEGTGKHYINRADMAAAQLKELDQIAKEFRKTTKPEERAKLREKYQIAIFYNSRNGFNNEKYGLEFFLKLMNEAVDKLEKPELADDPSVAYLKNDPDKKNELLGRLKDLRNSLKTKLDEMNKTLTKFNNLLVKIG